MEMEIGIEEDNGNIPNDNSEKDESDTGECDFSEDCKPDEDDDNDQSDDEEDAEEAEIKLLEASLAENPYDYTSHVTLISKLQNIGELERLRAAREAMNSKYPLSPELWLSWIRDEIKLATTVEQKAEVVKICQRAVKDYLSVEVWLEYLQFSIGNMGTEKDAVKNVRQLFEQALTAVGLHTIKGAIIWEAFREFEAVLYALIDGENQAERKVQVDRVGNIFRRQLACPLLDMEKTYEEYQAWRNGDGSEAAIDDKIVIGGYEQALRNLNSRLPFEEKVVSIQAEEELLDAYKAYLLYEKQIGDPGRIIVLYERAVADLSLEAALWLDYVSYVEDNIKIQHIVEQIYERAARNVPWCSAIWQKWMKSHEKWKKPILEIQSLLENGLAAGFSTADDYRSLWMTYLEYLRRRIDQYSDEKDKQIDVLRNTFNRACEHLAKYFGLNGDPNCIILQYWARTEAIHANNMEKARALWADILSQGHSTTASYWLEYISLERCYGDTKHLRKLFQKALSSVKDWPESIANSWMDFERDEGSLEQMEFCELKVREKLNKVEEEKRKLQQTSNYNEPADYQHTKPGKRKFDEFGRWKNLGGSFSKIVKIETSRKPKIRESKLNPIKTVAEQDNEEPKSKVAPPPGFKPTDSEKMDVEPEHEIDNKLTVFVSNLDYTATEEEVKAGLESAGPIIAIRMIRDYKGRSKGYCYVQLSSEAAVEKALQLDRTPVGDRPMFVSRCDPNKTTRKTVFKYSSTLEKNKLFIKGLPVTTTKEQLEEIFKAHGPLKEVRLVTYRNGHSKGLAYVEFENEASAAKALLATDGRKIEDKEISVAISQPPARKNIPTETSPIKSLGGSKVSRTAFGMPKTLLSMIPRNVKPTTTNSKNVVPADQNLHGTQAFNNQDFRNMFLNKK